MNNNQVLKELEVKNKEIYINKLNIDIDSHIEVLLLTCNNLFILLSDEMIDKIQEIINNESNNIENCIKSFTDNLNNKLKQMIFNKKTYIIEQIKNIDNVDYEKEIKEYSLVIINKVDRLYLKNINVICENLNISDDFILARTNDYLENIFHQKFINKIKEIFDNNDIILINNYHESYERYQDLNSKTIKM